MMNIMPLLNILVNLQWSERYNIDWLIGHIPFTTFNVSNLIEYKEPMIIPSEPFGLDPIFESEPIPKCPPTAFPKKREKIEQILDDKIVTTRNRDYYHYLVHWQG